MGVRRRVGNLWRFFRRPQVFDVTLVVILGLPGLVAGVATLVTGAIISFPLIYLLSVLALLIRRKRPVLTVVLLLGLEIISTAFALTTGNPILAIGLYSLGRYAEGRKVALVSVPCAAVYAAALEISARLSPDPYPKGLWLAAVFTFANGAVALIEDTWTADRGFGFQRSEVIGSAGTICDDKGPWGRIAARGAFGYDGWVGLEPAKDQGGVMAHMAAVVRGESAPIVSAADGRANLAACLAFYEAARTGKTVKL